MSTKLCDMIRMAGTAAGAIAVGVLIHRTAYWDGWHKGVARGRELGMAEAQRRHVPHKVVLDGTPKLTFHDDLPVGAVLPGDWFRA
jgi:hypothetical protein